MSRGRLLSTLVIAAAGLIGLVAYPAEPDATVYALVFALIVAGVGSVAFATEPEALEGAVTLPRSRWKALALAPFLRGGGRGALHLLLNLGLGLVLFLATRALWVWSEPLWGHDDSYQMAIVCAYGASWVLLPAGLFALRWPDGSHRRLARLAIVSLPAAFTLWSELTPDPWPPVGDVRRFRSLLDFVHRDGYVVPEAHGALSILATLTAASIAVNVPRMVRGIREVLSARPRSAPVWSSPPSLGEHAAAAGSSPADGGGEGLR